jgi:hypothetical protein
MAFISWAGPYPALAFEVQDSALKSVQEYLACLAAFLLDGLWLTTVYPDRPGGVPSEGISTHCRRIFISVASHF